MTKPIEDFYLSKGRISSRCKICINELTCQKVKANPQKKRHWKLLRNYRLSSQQYAELLARQGGVCAVCGKAPEGFHYGKPRQLAVDHCHKTGAVRGLLCYRCNQALGFLQEDPEVIEALLRYVQERVLPPREQKC